MPTSLLGDWERHLLEAVEPFSLQWASKEKGSQHGRSCCEDRDWPRVLSLGRPVRLEQGKQGGCGVDVVVGALPTLF